VAVIPSAVDPGQAEQAVTRGARLGSERLAVHEGGAPGDGLLPDGRVDGRRDDSGHRCGVGQSRTIGMERGALMRRAAPSPNTRPVTLQHSLVLGLGFLQSPQAVEHVREVVAAGQGVRVLLT